MRSETRAAGQESDDGIEGRAGLAQDADCQERSSDRPLTSRAEPETTVTNTWTAPPTAGPVHLWVVLRDNRGGTAVAEYSLQVP